MRRGDYRSGPREQIFCLRPAPVIKFSTTGSGIGRDGLAVRAPENLRLKRRAFVAEPPWKSKPFAAARLRICQRASADPPGNPEKKWRKQAYYCL